MLVCLCQSLRTPKFWSIWPHSKNMWRIIKKKSESSKSTGKEESQVKKCKPFNYFTCFWNIIVTGLLLYFFSRKGSSQLGNFLKFCFHTKSSGTEKQNMENNCNGIKLHQWKFKLLYKWNSVGCIKGCTHLSKGGLKDYGSGVTNDVTVNSVQLQCYWNKKVSCFSSPILLFCFLSMMIPIYVTDKTVT